MPENNWRSEFGFYKLMSLLHSLGCEGQVISDATTWFWRQSKTWIAETEAEFDTIAKAEISRQFQPVVEKHCEKSYGQRCREQQAELAYRNVEVLIGGPVSDTQAEEIQRIAKAKDKDGRFLFVTAREIVEALKLAKDKEGRFLLPKPEPWKRCQHWQPGSPRHCMICFAKLPPGTVELLQAMYGDNKDTARQKYVRYRLGVERAGLTAARYKDLEQLVWLKVSNSITGFTPRPNLKMDGAAAWLSKVVHSVVLDYNKQASTQTQKLEVDDWDTSNSPMPAFDGQGDPENPLFAKKVTPSGVGADGDEPADDESYDVRPE
jgi:hypothetical protein